MKIIRVTKGPDVPTFGVLLSQKIPFAVSLELPWRDNHNSESCIPTGRYRCQRFHSEKHPNTFQVMDVPGRTGILFHVANRVRDLLGCVGVAEKFEPLDGEWAVQESTQGFAEFLRICGGFDEFELEIVEAL